MSKSLMVSTPKPPEKSTKSQFWLIFIKNGISHHQSQNYTCKNNKRNTQKNYFNAVATLLFR